MKQWKKIILGVLAILLLFSIIYIQQIAFLISLFSDQFSLISKSEDLQLAINNEQIPAEIKQQLVFVPKIMAFGDRFGFPETKAYSSYIQLPREVFLHSLTASKKDSFEEYFWYWPFIGKLPYKGFIDKEDALREQAELKRLNYDTDLGESSAMSTLGYLDEPIITTMINKNDSTVLINTLFHERTHQLFFRQNDITFNENAATMIGAIAALDFIKQELGNNSLEYLHQTQRIHDQIIFSQFINEFYLDLTKLYQSNFSSEEKIQRRDLIFNGYNEKFKTIKEKQLQRYFTRFDQEEINNAYILSYYRYYGRLFVYYRVYEKFNQDVPKTIQFFNQIATGNEDPETAINTFLAQS